MPCVGLNWSCGSEEEKYLSICVNLLFHCYPPRKGYQPAFVLLTDLLIQWCSGSRLKFEMDSVVLEVEIWHTAFLKLGFKKKKSSVNFSLFCTYLPLEKDVNIYFKRTPFDPNMAEISPVRNSEEEFYNVKRFTDWRRDIETPDDPKITVVGF